MVLREKQRPKSLDEQLVEQIMARMAREGQRGPNSPLEVPPRAHTTGLYTPESGDSHGTPLLAQKEMMNKPQRFNGDKAKYRVWKMEMQLKLEYDGPLLARRGMYLPSYVISLLDGDAGSFALHRLPDILAKSYPMERL